MTSPAAAPETQYPSIELMRDLVKLPHDAMTHVANLEFHYGLLLTDLASLRQEVGRLEGERDNLKLQAQCHAMEARSANATIAEIYQACTGATGEPGNWNGARPVIAALAAAEADRRRQR